MQVHNNVPLRTESASSSSTSGKCMWNKFHTFSRNVVSPPSPRFGITKPPIASSLQTSTTLIDLGHGTVNWPDAPEQRWASTARTTTASSRYCI